MPNLSALRGSAGASPESEERGSNEDRHAARYVELSFGRIRKPVGSRKISAPTAPVRRVVKAWTRPISPESTTVKRCPLAVEEILTKQRRRIARGESQCIVLA